MLREVLINLDQSTFLRNLIADLSDHCYQRTQAHERGRRRNLELSRQILTFSLRILHHQICLVVRNFDSIKDFWFSSWSTHFVGAQSDLGTSTSRLTTKEKRFQRFLRKKHRMRNQNRVKSYPQLRYVVALILLQLLHNTLI